MSLYCPILACLLSPMYLLADTVWAGLVRLSRGFILSGQEKKKEYLSSQSTERRKKKEEITEEIDY